MTPPPERSATSTRTVSARTTSLLAAPVTALVWAALLLAPALYVIELTGPRWLNLVLRGAWVALVVVIAVVVSSRWVSTRSGPRA